MSKLSIDQMKCVFSGEYFLDDAIKEFVRSQLSYRYLLVADDPTARALERYGLQIAKGQGGVVECFVSWPFASGFITLAANRLHVLSAGFTYNWKMDYLSKIESN